MTTPETPTRTRRATVAASAFCLLLASVALPACAPDRPPGRFPTRPVRGRVLFQGKPLYGALVTFHPVDESRFGSDVPRPTGHTDDGRFRLTTTTADDGAPVGAYVVTVAGLARPQNEGSVLPDPKKALVKADATKGRYLDPKTSGLKAEVKEGEEEIPPFDLK